MENSPSFLSYDAVHDRDHEESVNERHTSPSHHFCPSLLEHQFYPTSSLSSGRCPRYASV